MDELVLMVSERKTPGEAPPFPVDFAKVEKIRQETAELVDRIFRRAA